MDYADAQNLVRHYVCSICWNDLMMKEENDDLIVACTHCDNRTFVTRNYAERRRAESIHELIEAERILEDSGVIPPKPKRTPEQIIKDLGF